jgi:cob(I)alamin adenosyltransferase
MGRTCRVREPDRLMPKPTRIYTRTGDDGTTGLVGGQRVKKNDLRIDTYGCVDELSSAIGVARAALPPGATPQQPGTAGNVARQLDTWLAWTQDVLFNLGSDLATLPGDRWEGMPRITAADATALERGIDLASAALPPLDTFIHPGGAPAGAALHVARTVARRAERLLISLGEREEIAPELIRYINRLSDALFVWARWINHALAQPEHRWNAKTAPPG